MALLAAKYSKERLEELADMAEVILALPGQYGSNEEGLLALVHHKRKSRGGFSKGYLYCGDEAAKEITGELLASLRIEIGVAEAAVRRPMPESDVRQTQRLIGTDRYVAHAIDHKVMNAGVPA